MTHSSALWRGSAAIVTARLAMSAGRLLAIIMVARLGGITELGAFVLLLSLLAFFEWLADFGQTDIAIREAGREAPNDGGIDAALTVLKRVAVVPLLIGLPAASLLIGHGNALLLAATLAAPGIAALALAQPARMRARLALRPWIDVGAEALAFCLFLLLVGVVAAHGASAALLGAAYSLFRIAQLAIVSRFAPAAADTTVALRGPAAAKLAREALPLGAAGLLVAAYDNLAPILLSHIASLQTVGEYAAAARFALPVVMVVQAINSAFFPLLVRVQQSRDQLSRLQQTALESSLICATLLCAGLFSASAALVALVGADGPEPAMLLRILALVVIARAVTTSMSPLIVIAGRQGAALWLTVVSVIVQLAAILLLFPRFGLPAVGAAFLLVELTIGVLPVSLIGLRATGIRLNFGRPAAIAACAAVGSSAVYLTPLDGSFIGGAAASAIAAAILAAAGLIPVGQMASRLRTARVVPS